MTRRKRWFLLAAVPAALALGASAVLALRVSPPRLIDDGRVTAARETVTEVASVAGSIEPHRQVDIHTRVAGEVVEVLVEEGQTVEEGQVLFRLDPVDAQRDLDAARSAASRARASLAEARAQLTASRAGAERAGETASLGERGVTLGVTSADDARQDDHERTLADAEVAVRQAQVRSARTQIVEAVLATTRNPRNLTGPSAWSARGPAWITSSWPLPCAA